MISITEERLRNFIEKLAGSLTEETRVDVRPGDNWAAYPGRKPPLLTYKLADVATIGDQILSVTAHEIAHLLFTTPGKIDFPFDVGKYPRSAQLLLNAVEDSRIERIFADHFPGARSLFDAMSAYVYDGKVQRGFPELPAKWRFILNIDRVLHGLEPWGEQSDLDAIEGALDHVIASMWEDTTEGAASHLEVPFRIMVELIKREKLQDSGAVVPPHLELPPELLGLPSDYESNSVQPDVEEGGPSGASSEHGFDEGADSDDHQQGGTDSTQGKRAQADGAGAGKGDGDEGVGEGDKAGKADKGDGKGGGLKGGSIDSSWGDPNDKSLPGDENPAQSQTTDDKTTNIIEEMVKEELARGSNNKTIDILSYRQRQRAKEAKEIDRQIEAEKKAAYDELTKILGRQRHDPEFVRRMEANVKKYHQDKTELEQEIRVLRSYARNVLRENAATRYGGNHTSGRKIKTHRLSRLSHDDYRILERKEDIGGKSYSIAVVVDQSSSMRSGMKSHLAYRAALVFLEAFEGIVDTVAIGFSDIQAPDPGGFPGGGYPPHYTYSHSRYGNRTSHLTPEEAWRIKNARTYKPLDKDLKLMKAMVPELERTYSSTPMEYGMRVALDELATSEKEVNAILIITDGEPNSPMDAELEFKRASRLGIETYAMYIGGRQPGDTTTQPMGLTWLSSVADHVVEVRTVPAIPQAVYRLLRSVVRRQRGVA